MYWNTELCLRVCRDFRIEFICCFSRDSMLMVLMRSWSRRGFLAMRAERFYMSYDDLMK